MCNESTFTALVVRLRAASCGYEEWRVQNPHDGAYCISFNWREVHNPERHAREWLADHCRRFPSSPHARYEVMCVRVQTEEDKLMQDAANEIERALPVMREYARKNPRHQYGEQEQDPNGVHA